MKQTQNQMVLDMLRSHPEGSTSRDALQELGVARLAARINDLKNMGYVIDSEMLKVVTRYGTTRVASYRLKGGKE